MFVTIVEVVVKVECLADFIEATRINHEASVQEPGNLRFDILQSPTDPQRFVFYEAYATEAAAKLHKETAHYLHWRDTVAPYMETPRIGTPYIGIFPADRA